MRFLDTNIFIRFIAKPTTENDVRFSQSAADLFSVAGRNREQFTTTDAVIAEVVFILSDSRHYGFTRLEVLVRLVPLLRLPGCAMKNREEVVAAMGRWEGNPKISFVDALSITVSQKHEFELVTFDTAMAKAAKTSRWDLRSSETNS